MSYIAIGASQVPPGKFFKPNSPAVNQKLKPLAAQEWEEVLNLSGPLLISNLFADKFTTHDYRYAVRITVDGQVWPIIECGGEGVKTTEIIDQAITTAVGDLPLVGPMFFPNGVKIEILCEWDIIVSTYAYLEVTYIPGTLTNVNPETDASIIVNRIGDVAVVNKTYQQTTPVKTIATSGSILNSWNTILSTTDPVEITKLLTRSRSGGTAELRVTVDGEVWDIHTHGNNASSTEELPVIGNIEGSTSHVFSKGITVEVKCTTNSAIISSCILVYTLGKMVSLELDPELIEPPVAGSGVALGGSMMTMRRGAEFAIEEELFFKAGHVVTDPDVLATIDPNLHEHGVAYEDITSRLPSYSANSITVASDTGVVIYATVGSQGFTRFNPVTEVWDNMSNVRITSGIYSIQTDHAGKWVIGTNNYIYTSEDDGLTFTNRGRVDGYRDDFKMAVIEYDKYTGHWVILTEGDPSTGGDCYYSYNGIDFIKSDTFLSTYYNKDVHLIKPTNDLGIWWCVIWVGNSMLRLMRSTNGGKTWTYVTYDGQNEWVDNIEPCAMYAIGEYFYMIIRGNTSTNVRSVYRLFKYNSTSLIPVDTRKYLFSDSYGFDELGVGNYFKGGVYFRNGMVTYDGYGFVRNQFEVSDDNVDSSIVAPFMNASENNLFSSFHFLTDKPTVQKSVPSVGTKIPYTEGSLSQAIRVK